MASAQTMFDKIWQRHTIAAEQDETLLYVARCLIHEGSSHTFDRMGKEGRKAAEPDKVFAELSGGNQQKALVAKWFEANPRVLLLHEPTQGVDVGSRKQIFSRIREFSEAGGAILVASVEYEDLAHLCDRVIVFRNGRAVSELRKPNLSEHQIVEQCFRTGEGVA